MKDPIKIDEDVVEPEDMSTPVLGILAGTGFDTWTPVEAHPKGYTTIWGEPSMEPLAFEMHEKTVMLLRRHGPGHKIPPHKINNKANLATLKMAGCKKIIGVGSSGSLRKGSFVPSLVVPDDYICLFDQTIHEEEVKHVVPGFDDDMRKFIIEAAKDLAMEVVDGGVYVQSRGPRLETKAEIKMYAEFGDVIGMTLGTEATLAREMELEYAAIASVDNLAHGLSAEIPNYYEIVESAERNASRIAAIIEQVVMTL